MASRANQGSITSFFGTNGGGNSNVQNKKGLQLNRGEKLSLLLDNIKSQKQEKHTGGSVDGFGDTPYYQQNLSKIEAKKKAQQKAKRKRLDDNGISKDILDQMNSNMSHGPTWGDHTEGRAHWKGYFEHKNEKLRKQSKLSEQSIYGDLSSIGVCYDKKTISKHKENRLKSAKKLNGKRTRIGDDVKESSPPKKRRISCSNNDSSVEKEKSPQFEGIFSRVTVYFNGRTDDLSNFHLKKVVVLNGGNFRANMSKEVTHVITNNLCRSKINRAVEKMGKARASHAFYVRAGWITDSIRAGRLLKEEDYMVFKTKKYGNIQSYFATKS